MLFISYHLRSSSNFVLLLISYLVIYYFFKNFCHWINCFEKLLYQEVLSFVFVKWRKFIMLIIFIQKIVEGCYICQIHSQVEETITKLTSYSSEMLKIF